LAQRLQLELTFRATMIASIVVLFMIKAFPFSYHHDRFDRGAALHLMPGMR